MLLSGFYFLAKLALVQLYPAYVCYKAIKVDDQRQFRPLLMYWVVATSFLVVEYFANMFLFWVPFYTLIKLVVLFYLILPQTKGTMVFYVEILDPFLTRHEDRIDGTLIEIQAKIKRTVIMYSKRGFRALRSILYDVILGKSENEETNAATVADTAPSVQANANDYLSTINPYSIFATLISRSAQQLQSQSTADPSASPSTNEPAGLVTAGKRRMSSPEDPKVERVDSYDSLASFVTSRRAKGSSASSTPTATDANAATWSGYFASWIWKKDEKEE
ncbi:TB2/DP1, HVA22 family-domain-containing protein [Radiomyces spectabilis]|uniref:TB2/DP1, HVA22 family-domain-containing protein n=1 Tax=Radiomyces spectabilis TaxID=64574 RepID=UPI0022200883|nr:TB2/DP1, HVA22 family-domain-containing protein [Radiomyces spectabilis]KAI8384673.1 TB2/DP1, HVA22 family-domain-containing protein [Radiomyces spectabilis]